MKNKEIKSDKTSQRDYVQYLGHEVTLCFPDINLEGVLNKIDTTEGIVELCSYINSCADQEHVYLENGLPITIPLCKLARSSNSRPIYIPRPNGYLQGKVDRLNRDADSRINEIRGFRSSLKDKSE